MSSPGTLSNPDTPESQYPKIKAVEPNFTSVQSPILDASNVYNYLHQYYPSGSTRGIPKYFIVKSIGKASPFWEQKTNMFRFNNSFFVRTYGRLQQYQ